MINSNYYTLDAIKKSPTPIQAARAGNLVHMAFQFRRQSAKQELTPIIVQGKVHIIEEFPQHFEIWSKSACLMFMSIQGLPLSSFFD